LGKIGSSDKKALTALVEAAQADESEEVKQKAMAALLLTGKPAIPSLVAMFRDDPHNPGYPLVFSFFGPDAKEALPLVLQSLGDKDDRVRRASVLALRSFRDNSPDVIAALRNVALKDPSPKTSAVAMEATKYLLSVKKSPGTPRR
jgi:HEAT repeat protein